MFLLPDQIIPGVYSELAPLIRGGGKLVGFAHGFAFHFGLIEVFPGCQYFLVGPKGAGALLRQEFEKGAGLPGIFALSPADSVPLRELCLSYAKAVGLGAQLSRRNDFSGGNRVRSLRGADRSCAAGSSS